MAGALVAIAALGCHGRDPEVPKLPPMGPEVAPRIARVEQGLWALGAPGGRPAPREPIAARMAFYQVPAVSVAVIHGYAIEWARAYGSREPGGEDRVDAGTMFQAASVSKPVTALGAIVLAQRGAFALDEDVNRRLVSWHLPESPYLHGHPVTVRELLSHSAAITVHGFNGYDERAPLPTLFQVLTGAPPANSAPILVDAVPGSIERYSGGGYTVLQQLMMDVTQRPFPSLMKELVLGPLEMTHSTFEQPLPEDLHDHAAAGTLERRRPVAGRWHTYPEMAAAGLWTTPVDLARFAIEIQRAATGARGRVLDPLWAREMIRPQIKNAALGLFLAGSGESRRFMHNGANAGYRSLLVAYPSGDGAVVMTNSDTGAELAEEIIRAIAVEYGWKGYLPRDAPVPIAALDDPVETPGG